MSVIPDCNSGLILPPTYSHPLTLEQKAIGEFSESYVITSCHNLLCSFEARIVALVTTPFCSRQSLRPPCTLSRNCWLS